MLEIKVEIELGTANKCGMKLLRSADGERGVEISYVGQSLLIDGERFELPKTHQQGTIDLHVFLDKTVLEVFADDGRVCITRIVASENDDLGAELFASGGTANVQSLDAWKLKTHLERTE